MNAVGQVVPSIPREEWTSHPRFATQALLLGSHANFRRVSRYLVEKASKEEFVGLHSLFDRWIAAMRSHEAYEERKLYPYLEYRWGASLDAARAGHDELHARADEVVDAFRSLARPADTVESIAEVLMFLKENPGSTRKHLLEILHPSLDPGSPEAKKALEPLGWLIERGHIIEFFNGTLSVPLGNSRR